MKDGKKSSAEKAVYMAMEFAAEKAKSKNPLEVLEAAFDNVLPAFEVKGRRVGGSNLQVPYPVQGHRRTHLAMMWFVSSARSKKECLTGSALELKSLMLTTNLDLP